MCLVRFIESLPDPTGVHRDSHRTWIRNWGAGQLGFGALFGGLLFTAGFGPGWVTIIGIVCGLGGMALVLTVLAYRPNQPTITPGAPMPTPPGGE